MTALPLREWQIAEIRKALSIQRSKREPSRLSLVTTLQLELDPVDLITPKKLLEDFLVLFLNELELKQRLVGAIIESSTRAAWLEKRNYLMGISKNESESRN